MSENDRKPDPDGHEPTEEVGPVGCEAGPEKCEIAPGADDAPVQGSQVLFADEVAEAFVAEPLTMILDPRDGLPIPAEESSVLALAPSFSIDNVVCIEDERTFVELFDDELEARDIDWPKTTKFIVLNRPRWNTDGVDRTRMAFQPDRVITRWGCRFVQMSAEEWEAAEAAMRADVPAGKELSVTVGDLPYVAVRPARERCAYYKRQVMSNDDQPDPSSPGHFIVFRNCTERRSVGGAFMSLRDEAVHACEYRSPPEPVSVEKHLDKKDRERLSAKVEQVSLFNLPINPMKPKTAGDVASAVAAVLLAHRDPGRPFESGPRAIDVALDRLAVTLVGSGDVSDLLAVSEARTGRRLPRAAATPTGVAVLDLLRALCDGSEVDVSIYAERVAASFTDPAASSVVRGAAPPTPRNS